MPPTRGCLRPAPASSGSQMSPTTTTEPWTRRRPHPAALLLHRALGSTLSAPARQAPSLITEPNGAGTAGPGLQPEAACRTSSPKGSSPSGWSTARTSSRLPTTLSSLAPHPPRARTQTPPQLYTVTAKSLCAPPTPSWSSQCSPFRPLPCPPAPLHPPLHPHLTDTSPSHHLSTSLTSTLKLTLPFLHTISHLLILQSSRSFQDHLVTPCALPLAYATWLSKITPMHRPITLPQAPGQGVMSGSPRSAC